MQELRENNARSQNRIREFEAPAEMELKDYRLGKVEKKAFQSIQASRICLQHDRGGTQ